MHSLTHWPAVSDADWNALREAARRHQQAGATWTDDARGHSIGLVFFNPSLRTRCSMELAAHQLGAHATTLTPGSGTWDFAWNDGAVMDGSEAEHVRDAFGVLSRYYDALGVRVFASLSDREQDESDALIQMVADAADGPVVNLESARYHPCQALGDATALAAHFGKEDLGGKRFVLSWAPHPKPLPRAVPHSALLMAARCGMDVTVARPDGFALDDGVMEQARTYADAQGASLTESADPDAAFSDAEVIYAKSWAGNAIYDSPGAEADQRAARGDWKITADRMARTASGAAFMHCLPVRRNVVVDDAVLDGPQSIHLPQAECRLHAQKAILEHVFA
jgi:N-acetylornithine carbamoyltransferase